MSAAPATGAPELIVVMRSSATAEEVQHVISLIEGAGAGVHVDAGGEGTVIGAIGDRAIVAGLPLEAVDGVERVVPLRKEYKRVSREFRSRDTIVTVGQCKVGGGHFAMMGGPCSIESYEQTLASAKAVKEAGGSMLRGGAYKPRTSPYAFQGLGLEGLRLLAEARERTGLPIITEVIEPAQVDMVAEFADVLQIGTRNMQNFSLLNAVGRTRMPVMLKRGLSGTIEEWLLAAEYILAAGNRQVILCERGIRTFETAARNTLDLNAVPILRRVTHLPVIVDPSHATGKRWMVAPMSYAGVAAGADGIMVEVHPKPEEAWSDGEQSLTLPMFSRLAGELRTIHSVVSPMFANPGEAAGR